MSFARKARRRHEPKNFSSGLNRAERRFRREEYALAAQVNNPVVFGVIHKHSNWNDRNNLPPPPK